MDRDTIFTLTVIFVLCSNLRLGLGRPAPAVIGKLVDSQEVLDNELKPLKDIRQIPAPIIHNKDDKVKIIQEHKLHGQKNRPTTATTTTTIKVDPHFANSGHTDSQRHMTHVPQPPYPLFKDPPSELLEDENHSRAKKNPLESLIAQRRAFLKILNEHQRHPKRKRHKVKDDDRYIILKYDSKNKKYVMEEADSGE